MPDLHTTTAALTVAESDLDEPFTQSLRDFLTDLRSLDPSIVSTLAAYKTMD